MTSFSREAIQETLDLFRQLEERPDQLKRLGTRIHSLNKGISHDAARVFSHSVNTAVIDFDDLLQQAEMGLWKAIRQFDTERKCTFAAFAYPKCRSELLHFRRDYGRQIKPPRSWQEKTDRCRSLAKLLNKDLPREHHITEAAVAAIEFGWTEQKWRQAIASTKRNSVSSLDAGEGEFPLRASATPDKRLEREAEVDEQRGHLARCLNRVDGQAQQYVMFQMAGMNHKAIATALGVSVRDVKQGIEQAMETMRRAA